MASAPETRIWAGRVGGDPSLERNRVYKYDVAGRSAVLQSVRFRAVPFAATETEAAAVMAGYLGAGGGFVEAGGLDGVTGWDAPGFLPGLGSVSGVAWSPITRVLVAVAPGGLWYSEDRGVSFTQVTSFPMYDVVYAPEISTFLAVGDGRAQMWSQDGRSWNSILPGATSPLVKVAWSGDLGRFVAVTHGVGGNGSAYYTDDPTVQMALSMTQVLGPGLGRPMGVTWVSALNRWVVVGEGGRWTTSSTGLPGSWSAFSTLSGSPDLRAVAANPAGRVVAVGAAGAAFYTDDLSSWSGASGPTSQMNAAMWSGVTFLAAGANGELWNAADGTSWALGVSVGGGIAYALGLMSPVTYLGALDAPVVNIIHESASRPAASARFPVSLFSIGSVFPVGVMLGESANIVDVPLRLDWEIGPGDVLRIDTPLGLNVAIEFEAEMLQAPTFGDAPRGF